MTVTEPPPISTVGQILRARKRLHRCGQRLVFTNGCFDILHSGHVSYLTFARAQGDALVVAINSDASVRANKGQRRPINPAEERAGVLLGLRAVDHVMVFEEEEPIAVLEQIRPDVLVKGADWAHYVSGRKVVESYGGEVVLADLVPGRSTSGTIERVLRAYGPTATAGANGGRTEPRS
ncbi:adenylyltransferase/cytidyltransferase family protein [Phytohabitans sp. ZYX-F-186]|uniref:Adenylyltransferase/cytidyltransferase family protein n=1 Tax=Phytohabitans maris TaxID=3071409 RepID=A0ABU0ZY38_9ACTN|nr:adenylyltransferase/cytidyltransferase family protein [Phytohabitans sp. ZYX-F-186]MDQ7911199.1 adenylyltransferase/cytidyltransferase family protein [Phytohabitans sp. ZYX-F-186]